MRRLRLIMLLGIAVWVMAACGIIPSASVPTPTPEPTKRPTSTPRPTPKPRPTSTPKPTAEPTTEPTPEPEATPEVQEGTLREVEMENLQPFEHESGLFTIDIPEDWTLQDNSKEGEVIMLWTDPSNNGLIVVDIFESDQERSQDELIELLQNHLKSSFEDEPDFTMEDPKPQSDGSILIVWSYTATASGDVKAELLGNSFIDQRGNKIALLTTAIPNEQFDRLEESLNTVINSFRFDPEVPIGGTANTNDTGDTNLNTVTYDFEQSNEDWFTGSGEGLEASIEDGVYTIMITSPDSYFLSDNLAMEQGTDMSMGADVQILGDSRAGVALRLSDDENGAHTYYACWIDGDDHYGCFYAIKNQLTTLQEPISAGAIQPGESNRLVLTTFGDQVTFSVNGTDVATFTNDKVTSGVAALYLENFSTEAGAAFDNVTIVTPKSS